jgi:hypothetical protein
MLTTGLHWILVAYRRILNIIFRLNFYALEDVTFIIDCLFIYLFFILKIHIKKAC